MGDDRQRSGEEYETGWNSVLDDGEFIWGNVGFEFLRLFSFKS